MIMIVVLIAVIGVVVVATGMGSSVIKPRVSPEDLDLSSVRNAVMEKRGWTRERADAAEAEYVRFLTLLRTKPGFMVVPWSNADGEDDLDQFWHQHILDTAGYAAACQAVFGRMIHHNPHVVVGSKEEMDAVLKTRRLYARRYGGGDAGDGGEVFVMAGCGADAGDANHDAGHGGHGDGGHGDGGHGCGGHSCGGHGCGSCGGH